MLTPVLWPQLLHYASSFMEEIEDAEGYGCVSPVA